MVVAAEYLRLTRSCSWISAGELGIEFTQNKRELGYPSVVAVNTDGGVLTKVGGDGGETGVSIGEGIE